MNKQNTALLFSTMLMATNAYAYWEENWLFGVSAGRAWHAKNDNVSLILSETNSVSFAIKNDSDTNQFILGALAGYSARCCNWLVGFEVNVDWRNEDDDINFVVNNPAALGVIVGTVSLARDVVWGITARLGYDVLPCLMPYIRLGADFGDRDNDFSAISPFPLPPIIWASENDSVGRWSFVGGVGLEWFMPVADLSLRAEWDYHNRGAHDDQIIALASNNTTLITIKGIGDRHEQTLRASLVYNIPI